MPHGEANRVPPILPVGTAVVTTVEIKKRDGNTVCPRGSVVARAGGACENCRLLEAAAGVTFHVEHFVPRSQGWSG